MNVYENDINWFLNVYANTLKEKGKAVAIVELKKAINKEYPKEMRGSKKESLLFTSFFGEIQVISISRFYRYIMNWYHRVGAKFKATDKYVFEEGENGDNPRELVPYGNYRASNKPIKRVEKRKESDEDDDVGLTVGRIM